jgi:mannose-6-phosphate isomerase-like protein (cupin superfamily)
MHTKHLHTPETDQTKWYRSPVLIVILLLLAMMVWFVLSGRAIRELEIQPTHLTLRSDSCGFLKTKGITTTPIEPGNWCSVVVPFRGSVIGGGGVITLGDRQIRVADDQVIEVGAIVDQPWTPEQTRSAIWAGISTLLMLAIVVWMVII